MRVNEYICNFCGKRVDGRSNTMNIKHQFGYESENYDGYLLDLDLCGECADKLTSFICENSQLDVLSVELNPF